MEKLKVKMFKVRNATIINQCYLIYKDNRGILVDPAWDFNLIDNFLVQNNIILKAVLLTHSHKDHTDLAEKFASERGISVYMSKEEIAYYNFTTPNLESVFHLKEIVIDSFRIIPIVTPGHTIGSTCYLVENNLFSGDTIFIEGVGICDYENADKLYHSVQFIKNNLSSTTIFWPGHSFGQSPGKDLQYLSKNNIYFQLENKEHFIKYRTRKNAPNPFKFE